MSACGGIAQPHAEPELPGAALEHLPVSENHDARGNFFRARARQISGPMPAGSPEVTAMTGTEFAPRAAAARDTPAFQVARSPSSRRIST